MFSFLTTYDVNLGDPYVLKARFVLPNYIFLGGITESHEQIEIWLGCHGQQFHSTFYVGMYGKNSYFTK
jgi:hypothetical protein